MPGFGNIPTLTFSAPVTGLAPLLAAAARKMLHETDSGTPWWDCPPGICVHVPLHAVLTKKQQNATRTPRGCQLGRTPGTWPGNVGTLGPGPSTLRAHCPWGGRVSGASLSLTGFFPQKKPLQGGVVSPPQRIVPRPSWNGGAGRAPHRVSTRRKQEEVPQAKVPQFLLEK